MVELCIPIVIGKISQFGSVDFCMFSVHMLGVSSLMNSINVIGTILVCRRRYYGFNRMTLFI